MLKTLIALALAAAPGHAFAKSGCPGIHVRILDIRNSTGTVACALFESADGFPIEFLHAATNVMVIKVRKSQARCDFEDIPPGIYALAVIHDENMNGELDTNVDPSSTLQVVNALLFAAVIALSVYQLATPEPHLWPFYAVAGLALVLGRIGAVIHRDIIAGDEMIVTGWRIASDGRKHQAGTAIHDSQGRLCAAAEARAAGHQGSGGL